MSDTASTDAPGRGLAPEDLYPILGLSTQAYEWANLFMAHFDLEENEMTLEAVTEWFDNCIGTSKRMAVANMPLPPLFGRKA